MIFYKEDIMKIIIGRKDIINSGSISMITTMKMMVPMIQKMKTNTLPREE